MSKIYEIGGKALTIRDLEKILKENKKITLSETAINKVTSCRAYFESKLTDSDDPIYGINTGFGSLYDVRIPDEDLEQLQRNLVLSHSSGTGDEIPEEIVKLMVILKIQSLSLGHSAIQLATIQRLVDGFNERVFPVIYTLGSLGASGDLVPLAHLSLPLLGEGDVDFKGKRTGAKEALNSLKWDPLHLKAKEGLALINGTQMMSAYGSWCIMHSLRLSKIADIVGALSLDAFNCRLEPFDELTQEIHPHPGQVQTAENIRNLLKGSAMRDLPKEQLQDPYSFRCIPQVHGACKQVIDQTRSTIKIEINSVSDNPNVFPEEDKILSGGNFHGEYMALGLDMLAIALAELGNIAERRMFQLLGGLRGLPVYLTSNAGLQSGLMTLQYTAASIVSQNKQLATPASVDSIVSSNGQEDHVSMGANSATKAYQVVLNLERVLALELMIAAQAMEMRKPTGTSKVLEALLVDYRKVVKPLNGDRVTDKDIANTIAFLRETPLPI